MDVAAYGMPSLAGVSDLAVRGGIWPDARPGMVEYVMRSVLYTVLSARPHLPTINVDEHITMANQLADLHETDSAKSGDKSTGQTYFARLRYNHRLG